MKNKNIFKINYDKKYKIEPILHKQKTVTFLPKIKNN
jgi:hypothetical protein